jgi:uncharacterized protein
MAKFLNNWIFALVLAALICAGCKQSDSKTVAEDVADFSQMNFADVKAEADKGNPEAQFELGERFHFGNGVLKDSTESVEWLQKSAAQKFPPAELNLGIAYGKGDGVQKNEQEGVRLCRMAADSGMARAQATMGMIYFEGAGVQKNYPEAFNCFTVAANQNYSPSQYYLALCYRDGKGTTTNLTEFIFWLQRAASNGVANAQVKLGRFYGDNGVAQIESNSSSANLRTNSNFVLGVEWWQKAAHQGDTGGQIDLGTAYATGCGVDKDLVEAYKWLTLANAKDSNSVATLINNWKTDNIVFTSDQIMAGKQRAEEFSKTNHIAPFLLPEIPEL